VKASLLLVIASAMATLAICGEVLEPMSEASSLTTLREVTMNHPQLQINLVVHRLNASGHELGI